MTMQVNLDDTTRVIGLGKGGEIEVDVAKIAEHPAVVNYIFNYGLKQMLNDVHASEKDANAKLGLSQKKLDSLYKGEVAQARATSSGDKLAREMRLVATEIVRDKLRAIGKPWGKLSKDVQKSVVDKYLATYDADVRKAAQARLDATKGNASVELDLAELGL